MGGSAYSSVIGNWNQSEQEAQEERVRETQQLNARFQQIRHANQNIQGILQRRLVYMNPNQAENVIQPHRVPHSKLKVKHISFSLQRHSILLSPDFRTIDFLCDLEKQQLMSSRYRFLVKIEIAAIKKQKSLTAEQ